MTAKLAGDDGEARYAKRRETVEPVFGQIKEQQGARRFLRRGMRACNADQPPEPSPGLPSYKPHWGPASQPNQPPPMSSEELTSPAR
jgi:Transposase DDE domain